MRTCSLERARDAAEECLHGVERLSADAPILDAADQEEQARGRAQMHLMVKKLLGTLSIAAAAKWGGHWIVDDVEADSIAGPAVEVIELELGEVANDPWSRLWVALGMFAAPRILLSIGGSSAPKAAQQSAPTSSTIDVVGEVTRAKDHA